MTSLGAAALALTREYKPTAITLDIFLPDIEGWRVLERLKNDIATRHIPVCVISTEEARERALNSGALRFVAKPIQSKDVLDALLEHVKSYTAPGRAQRARGAAGPGAAARDRGLHRAAPRTSGSRVVDSGDVAVRADARSRCPTASCSTPACAS